MNSTYEIKFQNGELYHHGIKGQRWGVRRYQNEDGTLTNAGRKRYGEDLDINDRSRTNIAKIRKGEALRRLDNAKANGSSDYRIAELRGRVRTAKRTEKNMKTVDKGAKLASKGDTITGNNVKSYMALGSAVAASKVFNAALNHSLSNIASQGRLTTQHKVAADILSTAAQVAFIGAAGAYSLKKSSDNKNLRAYNSSRWNGESTIKKVGSQEYEDVLKRRKTETK